MPPLIFTLSGPPTLNVPALDDAPDRLSVRALLTFRIGGFDAKTKMLIGQSAGNLAALERKLLNELDEPPATTLTRKGENGQREQPEQKAGQSSGAMPTNRPASAKAEGGVPAGEGFLF